MPVVRCANCGAENDFLENLGKCPACGAKLSPALSPPRSSVTAGPASGVLFAIAAYWFLCGGLGQLTEDPRRWDRLTLWVALLVLFGGLSRWARRHPILAVVVGLVVQSAVTVLGFLADVSLNPAFFASVIFLGLLVWALVDAIRWRDRDRPNWE
jgi:uncharacterized membrane protein (UPF0136 family)